MALVALLVAFVVSLALTAKRLDWRVYTAIFVFTSVASVLFMLVYFRLFNTGG